MRSPKRHLRLVLRVLALAFVVTGAVLASSVLDLLQSSFDSSAAVPNAARVSAALAPLPWAIPLVLAGMVLLIVTTQRESRRISLTRAVDER